jgi:hypothetical protein
LPRGSLRVFCRSSPPVRPFNVNPPRFLHGERDRKITLNFALAARVPVDPGALLKYFRPRHFLIKITPRNPTSRDRENGLSSYIDPAQPDDPYPVVQALRSAGYTVIVSTGEREGGARSSLCPGPVRRPFSWRCRRRPNPFRRRAQGPRWEMPQVNPVAVGMREMIYRIL